MSGTVQGYTPSRRRKLGAIRKLVLLVAIFCLAGILTHSYVNRYIVSAGMQGPGAHVSPIAVSILKIEASLGVMSSQHNLGLLYANGLGVTKDLAKAKYWLLKAEGHGDKQAEAALTAVNAMG